MGKYKAAYSSTFSANSEENNCIFKALCMAACSLFSWNQTAVQPLFFKVQQEAVFSLAPFMKV